ncbi:MAG: hypothetical protein RLZZ32_968 [Cyanobacteriota bacterium]|jgi:hypothetical protein
MNPPRPRVDVWRCPRHPRRQQQTPAPLPQAPPPIEEQEAAIYAELCCWGRERLI